MKFRALCVCVLLIAPVCSFAKGPVGVGKLEIGMSRAAVEGLTVSDGVYLSSPLAPYEYKYTEPTPGHDMYKAKLVSPLSEEPLETTLTFAGDSLISIYVDLGDSPRMIDKMRELISAKYGSPKTENSMKEEQCIYKGGANFKVSSGYNRSLWNQERMNAEPILTSLLDTVIDTCPSNLRYAMGAIKSRSLSISIAPPPS